jgi:hypothetical protein
MWDVQAGKKAVRKASKRLHRKALEKQPYQDFQQDAPAHFQGSCQGLPLPDTANPQPLVSSLVHHAPLPSDSRADLLLQSPVADGARRGRSSKTPGPAPAHSAGVGIKRKNRSPKLPCQESLVGGESPKVKRRKAEVLRTSGSTITHTFWLGEEDGRRAEANHKGVAPGTGQQQLRLPGPQGMLPSTSLSGAISQDTPQPASIPPSPKTHLGFPQAPGEAPTWGTITLGPGHAARPSTAGPHGPSHVTQSPVNATRTLRTMPSGSETPSRAPPPRFHEPASTAQRVPAPQATEAGGLPKAQAPRPSKAGSSEEQSREQESSGEGSGDKEPNSEEDMAENAPARSDTKCVGTAKGAIPRVGAAKGGAAKAQAPHPLKADSSDDERSEEPTSEGSGGEESAGESSGAEESSGESGTEGPSSPDVEAMVEGCKPRAAAKGPVPQAGVPKGGSAASSEEESSEELSPGEETQDEDSSADEQQAETPPAVRSSKVPAATKGKPHQVGVPQKHARKSQAPSCLNADAPNKSSEEESPEDSSGEETSGESSGEEESTSSEANSEPSAEAAEPTRACLMARPAPKASLTAGAAKDAPLKTVPAKVASQKARKAGEGASKPALATKAPRKAVAAKHAPLMAGMSEAPSKPGATGFAVVGMGEPQSARPAKAVAAILQSEGPLNGLIEKPVSTGPPTGIVGRAEVAGLVAGVVRKPQSGSLSEDRLAKGVAAKPQSGRPAKGVAAKGAVAKLWSAGPAKGGVSKALLAGAEAGPTPLGGSIYIKAGGAHVNALRRTTSTPAASSSSEESGDEASSSSEEDSRSTGESRESQESGGPITAPAAAKKVAPPHPWSLAITTRVNRRVGPVRRVGTLALPLPRQGQRKMFPHRLKSVALRFPAQVRSSPASAGWLKRVRRLQAPPLRHQG